MAGQLTGKTYVVTGAASGIGLACAKVLLAEGANVSLCDLNLENLMKAVQDLNSPADRVLASAVNITHREAICSLLASTQDKFGAVHGVVNSAGTAGRELASHSVWEISDEEYGFVMDVNVRGAFNVIAEAMKPGVLVYGGSIVHIGSMFSLQGFEKGAVYSASKHAVLGLVRSAAKDGKERVRVNCVLPGAINTPMHQANLARIPDFVPAPSTPIPRDGTAEEVAHVVALLLSDKSKFVTGAAWSVDGGANI